MKYNFVRRMTTAALVATLAVSGYCTAQVSAAKKVPAKVIKITNGHDVIAVGEKVDLNRKLTPANSTDKTKWKSSDESIAKPDSQGRFTAKKSGTVTITATTTSGKKASIKILVVSKYGVSSVQSKIDRMLDAENIKNIYIKNLESEKTYTVKEGSYKNKTLRVDAPLSDVENHGVFKNVIINNVKNGTFHEYANGNQFTINDDELTFAVEKGASVKALQIARDNSEVTVNNAGNVKSMTVAAKTSVTVEGSGKVTTLNVKDEAKIAVGKDATVSKVKVNSADAKVDLNIDGSVSTVEVKNAKELTIGGQADKTVKVTIGKEMKGATIKVNVPVQMSVSSDVKVVLGENAQDSKIAVTNKDVKVEVEKEDTSEKC